MHFHCENAECRTLIFTNQGSAIPYCPGCWHIGVRVDTGTVDDLLRALDKRVSPMQLPLFRDSVDPRFRSRHAAS